MQAAILQSRRSDHSISTVKYACKLPLCACSIDSSHDKSQTQVQDIILTQASNWLQKI